MLGSALTHKMGRSRHGLVGCERWFESDGIHLSPEGYAKPADAAAFPMADFPCGPEGDGGGRGDTW